MPPKKTVKKAAPPKVKKIYDYSELKAGARVQAESEGTYYAAEVVTVSTSKSRAKAPVKISYKGYEGYDEWVGGDRLRSKAIKATTPPKPEKKEGEAPKEKVQKRLAVGKNLPNVTLDFGFPPEKVNVLERCKGKRVILVPGYLNNEYAMKAKGIAEVIVYCCNDAAVMGAWAKNQCTEGSMLTLMGDTRGYFTKRLGVTMKHPGPTSVLGAPRCKRHALYVDDGVIKAFEVAEAPDDPAGDAKPDVTLVENMLTHVPDLPDAEKEAAAAKVAEETKTDSDAATAAAKSADLVLMVKPGCPFCKDAFETLQNNGFNPKVIEATRSHKRGLQTLTGKTSVPSCWVKGTYIGGCNDGPEEGKGVKPMVASGALKKMLG